MCFLHHHLRPREWWCAVPRSQLVGVWRPNAVSCSQFALIEIWKLHLGLWGFGPFRRTRILPPRTDRVTGSVQAIEVIQAICLNVNSIDVSIAMMFASEVERHASFCLACEMTAG